MSVVADTLCSSYIGPTASDVG